MSFNLNLKTSCALPPYYSLELDPISSTSHYYLNSCPGEAPDHSGIEFSLKPSGKIVKLQNERTEFSHNEKFTSKIFKMSFNFDLKTSCALPPYYSLELNLISSTSHSNLFRSPRSRILMICCVSRAKMYI